MLPSTTSGESRTVWPGLTLAGILIVVLLCVAAFWLSRSRTDSNTLAIQQALAEGRIDEAAAQVDSWLRIQPDWALAHYLKARIAWARKDLNTADLELRRAQSLGYPWYELAGLQGLILARAGQLDAAEPPLREAFNRSPGADPEVAEALARLYLGTFRLSEASAVLKHWSEQAPKDAIPYLLQTEVDVRNHVRPAEIIERFRSALERDPGLLRARLGLAETLESNHQNTEAALEYAAYLASKPDDARGYLGAGRNALEMGRDQEALQWLERALTLSPRDPVVLAARATVELRLGHFESALQYLDRSIQIDPFDHGNRYQRMLVLTRLGRKTEADAERQAVERIRKEQDEFGKISRELVRAPLDTGLRFEAARWLIKHGHEDEALEWANLVLRTDPAHPQMNRLLADYYRSRHQLGLANFHEAHAAPSSAQERAPDPSAGK